MPLIFGLITFITSFSVNSAVLDEFIWLEDILSPQSLTWVENENEKTFDVLKSDSRYHEFYEYLLKEYNSDDRVPNVYINKGMAYNFWKDEKHPRGLLRQTSLSEYKKDNPSWDIVLDIDQLAHSENKNWVYDGIECNENRVRCLISLSIGGKDANVVREFNWQTKQFVKGGFYLPESKGSVAWLDNDTLLIARDFGPGSLTSSGYPMSIKIWRRGENYLDSQTIFKGDFEDVGVWTYGVGKDNGVNYQIIERGISFWENEYYVLENRKKLNKLNIGRGNRYIDIIDGQIFVYLYTDYLGFKKGSLISLSIDEAYSAESAQAPKLVYEPKHNETLKPNDIVSTKDYLVLTVLRDVVGRTLKAQMDDHGEWKVEEVPISGLATLSPTQSSGSDNNLYMTYESFLKPKSFIQLNLETFEMEVLKKSGSNIESDKFEVKQMFATSEDGTQIPYFIIHAKGLIYDGKNPTIQYGYGGFRVSLTPKYSMTMNELWLKHGGVYVIANIRGGGEYGPSWHSAALKQKRHKAYEDFIAVSEDLIARKVTSSRRLGIRGGSNGGLLMGAMLTQRPDLYNAILCQVPLLDMLRYSQLLAGASWMGEYGDPRVEEEREYLLSYSPYHNLKIEQKYPKTFFTTSTKDDRVHPGHARKMAAKMQSMGHAYLFYENREGGHGGSANNEQAAMVSSLAYVYFHQMLMD